MDEVGIETVKIPSFIGNLIKIYGRSHPREPKTYKIPDIKILGHLKHYFSCMEGCMGLQKKTLAWTLKVGGMGQDKDFCVN